MNGTEKEARVTGLILDLSPEPPTAQPGITELFKESTSLHSPADPPQLSTCSQHHTMYMFCKYTHSHMHIKKLAHLHCIAPPTSSYWVHIILTERKENPEETTKINFSGRLNGDLLLVLATAAIFLSLKLSSSSMHFYGGLL